MTFECKKGAQSLYYFKAMMQDYLNSTASVCVCVHTPAAGIHQLY